MSINIIGAGFGRTGTLSVKMALEKLGYEKCYHMHDLFSNPGHAETWNRIAHGETPNWPSLFEGYRSLIDWPCAYYWRELITYYPTAKVLLTVRDADSWYNSISETIFTAINNSFPNGATEATPPKGASDTAVEQISMAKRLIADNTFHRRLGDRKHCIAAYNQHNNEVQRLVPTEKLLVYNVKQGWEPLCRFLDVEVPDIAFPCSNSKEEFLSAMSKP